MPWPSNAYIGKWGSLAEYRQHAYNFVNLEMSEMNVSDPLFAGGVLPVFGACRYGNIRAIYPQSIVEEIVGIFIIAIGIMFIGIILGSVA